MSTEKIIIQSSSETRREEEIANNISIEKEFLDWFIGFTEGNGSFIIHDTKRLEFKITQSSIDAQILFHIKKKLGFGSASVQDKAQKIHHYYTKDKSSLLKLIYIFNGNLLTNHKRNEFKNWLNAFNDNYNLKIQYIENKPMFSLLNNWLCGFTDAIGCFMTNTLKKEERKTLVKVKYILSQKNELALFNDIAPLIKGKIAYLKSSDEYNLTVSFSNLPTIIKYFSKYPLKTKKYIWYTKWLKVYSLVKSSKESLDKKKPLVEKVNKK
jgi:hypothetical protein